MFFSRADVSGYDVRNVQMKVGLKKKRRYWQVILNGVLFLCFLALMYGCGGTPVWLRDDPSEVVKGYLQAVEIQDEDTVWEFLSQNTRSQLEHQAELFNQSHPSSLPRKGADMLRFGHVLSSTREYRKIVVSTEDESHAVVNIVLHDESTLSVDLFRESDRWAIGLPLDGMDTK